MIDEDLAHYAGGDAVEMRPALPVDLGVIDQAQVSFVHQGRGLERVVAALASQVAARYVAEFVVDH